MTACTERAPGTSNEQSPVLAAGTGMPRVEWPAYAGSGTSERWSPLADITPHNVSQLTLAWSWSTNEGTRKDSVSGMEMVPALFEATPIDIGDTLYLSTPFNRVIALDAQTGREYWAFDPGATRWGLIANDHAGFVHRGVATWSGNEGRRIFIGSRWQLFALDAHTGQRVLTFGDSGSADLSTDLRWPVDRLELGNTSPPVVWNDIVIVGSSVGDNVIHDRDPPGAVLAFNAVSGRRVWRWDPVPAVGTPERESWGGQSADHTGHANVWAPMSIDSARGIVYVPVSSPSNDWYGGNRPGDNLFGESLVALDARTGRRLWHQQIVRHGLWDYDLAAPPVLTTIRRERDTVDAVLVAAKTGYVYAFDRTTGHPLWPMVMRAAPPSDVPGEVTAQEQLHPTWPLPFAKQGFTTDDVVDFTPKIRERALAVLKGKRLGPLFTPPSRAGTVVMPGWIGGAGWGSTAVDPVRQLLFVKATNKPVLARLIATSDSVRFRLDSANPNPESPLLVPLPSYRDWLLRSVAWLDIPMNKPPYGTLTAYDLVTGATSWHITLGDTPEIRFHRQLRDLHLPPLGVAGAPGGLATGGGLIFITGGGSTLYAIESLTGQVAWSYPLGRVGYSNPMTYRAGDGRQYVVLATGQKDDAHLLAFALAGR